MITDALLGCRLRSRRRILGMSQQDLADVIGVTFQTVQKYEKGHVAMSACRVAQVAAALSVPVVYFFEAPAT